MSETYYRVVCDRHLTPVVLADITSDPNHEASQSYEREQRRWDRHNSGEEPIPVDEDLLRRPYPRDFRPYSPRHTSRQVSVNPHEYIFAPELVDPSGPDGHDWWERALWEAERVAQGKAAPTQRIRAHNRLRDGRHRARRRARNTDRL